MESNFIKERVVVREKLIKKNLEKDKNKSKKNSEETIEKSVIEDPPENVVALEELINDRLKQDLVEVSKQVDTVCQTIADYLKVKAALKIFRSNPRNVRVQTNLGCNFYAQCHVEDASKVYICLGRDYFLLMELDEALKMIDFKEKQWTKQLDILQDKASRLKAYIKIALEMMGRVYEVDREKLTSQV